MIKYSNINNKKKNNRVIGYAKDLASINTYLYIKLKIIFLVVYN